MSDETNKTVEERNREYSKGRGLAMGVSAFVYVGGVGVVTLMFISFVLLAFPPEAYFSKFIMTIGGLLIGGSMIAFPIALHKWTVERTHRAVTIFLYFLELLIVGMNTITSFIVLMSKFGGSVQTPGWVAFYEPLSIGAIVYTIAAWGLIWLLDPEHKRRAKDLQNQEKFEQKVAEQEEAFLDSPQGEDAIMAVAELRILEKYNVGRYQTGKKDWGTGRESDIARRLRGDSSPALPGPAAGSSAVNVDELARQLQEKYPEAYGGVSLDVLSDMIRAQSPVTKDPSGRR